MGEVLAGDFRAFPKIPRLNRQVTVTEKLDGTNAAVLIIPWKQCAIEVSDGYNWTEGYFREYHRNGKYLLKVVGEPRKKVRGESTWISYSDDAFAVFAQSRSRTITPEQDNYGFAKWVQEHAETLVEDLGEGYHYGEWWGQGIQRKYDQSRKWFSLFNTSRWDDVQYDFQTPGLAVVPVLYEGPFDTDAINTELKLLRAFGSKAAPGFMKPEGVIVFHHAANSYFKATVERDEEGAYTARAA